MRTRVVKRVLNVMMTAVLVLGILFFSSLSVKEYLPYARNRIQAERLQKEAAGRDEKGRRKINWKKLQKRNKDIIAWIEIPGTKVDYPIVKCPTRSYYLHHDAEGRNSILGAVFVQPETAGDFSDIHTVIYGHNMRAMAVERVTFHFSMVKVMRFSNTAMMVESAAKLINTKNSAPQS